MNNDKRAAIAAVAALVALTMTEPVLAACGDPPAPPIKLRVEALRFRPDLNPRATAITLHWENRASESRVCFEVEATGPNGFRRVDHTSTCGAGGKGWPKSLNFLNLTPDTRYCFKARAWTGSLGGDCKSPWSATVCGSTVPGFARECRQYADVAVGTLRLARETYKCDPKALAGPRWTASHRQHMDWCMGATAAARNAEAAARAREAQQCRIAAAKGGNRNPWLRVAQRDRDDIFYLSGDGYPPSAPIVVRVSGPAALGTPLTRDRHNRLIQANAAGFFVAHIPSVMVCKGPGTVRFVIEDRDGGKSSNTAEGKCRP
jgi:hypothetical protein